MSFQFSELHLGRGPVLARETSQVKQLFESLQATAGDPDTVRSEREEAQSMLDVLYTRIQNRIEELEDFYVEHDADDRALLFEKQRMALRRLLHAYSVSAEAKAREAQAARHKPPSGAAPPSGSVPAGGGGGNSGVGDNSGGGGRRGGGGGPSSSKGVEPPRMAYSTRKKHPSIGVKEDAKPIYAWEKRHGGGGGSSGGDSDGDAGGDGGESDSGAAVGLLDPFEQPEVAFEVVLTEQEFYNYTSRLREYSLSQRAKKVSAHPPVRARVSECWRLQRPPCGSE
jgi:hypothetical protein